MEEEYSKEDKVLEKWRLVQINFWNTLSETKFKKKNKLKRNKILVSSLKLIKWEQVLISRYRLIFIKIKSLKIQDLKQKT